MQSKPTTVLSVVANPRWQFQAGLRLDPARVGTTISPTLTNHAPHLQCLKSPIGRVLLSSSILQRSTERFDAAEETKAVVARMSLGPCRLLQYRVGKPRT